MRKLWGGFILQCALQIWSNTFLMFLPQGRTRLERASPPPPQSAWLPGHLSFLLRKAGVSSTLTVCIVGEMMTAGSPWGGPVL